MCGFHERLQWRWRLPCVYAVTLVFLTGTSAISSACRGDQPETADLPTILQRHREWRKSFVTIRVVWREWYRQGWVKLHPELDPDVVLGKTHYTRQEFVWSDLGAFRKEYVSFADGKPMHRDAMGTDGQIPWGAESKLGGDTNQWDMLMYYRPIPDRPLSSNFTFVGVYGLWDSSGFWFDELLARAKKLSVLTDEEVDDHLCVVVRVEPGSYDYSPSREDTYWLDPEHDFLPRRYRVRGSVPGKPGKDGLGHWYTWTANEFEKVDGRFWFPKRGTLLGGTEEPPGFEWVMEQVTLNESLPRTWFAAPAPQPGTKVIDYYHMTHQTTAPNSPNQPPMNNGAGNNNPAALATSQRPVSAVPPGSRWPWLGLIGASLLAVGLLVRWRQRSRNP